MARIIFRFASHVVPFLLPFTLGSALASAAGVDSALPVSPGDWQAGTPIADTCPSFSWGAVAGAQSYELAIFDAQWQDSPAYDDQLGQGQPLRHIDIAAPALSWTPAGADCLDAGGTFSQSTRRVSRKPIWVIRKPFSMPCKKPKPPSAGI